MREDATPSSRLDLKALKAPSPVRLGDGACPALVRAERLDAALSGLVSENLDRGQGAVVAVGGYGRGELSPHSDVDLLLLVPARRDGRPDTFKPLLYPLWDAGFQVGHALVTAADAIGRAQADIEAATSLLSARLVAGNQDLFDELLDRRRRWVARDRKRLARRIADTSARRHASVDRAGWSLAPDLKDDLGGLRDVHAVSWLRHVAGDTSTEPVLDDAYRLLVDVREALHALVPRRTDRVRLDLQPKIATLVGIDGDDGSDRLMARVHTAARRIEQCARLAADALVDAATGGPRRSGSTRPLGGGVNMVDGALRLEGAPTPHAALQLLAAHSSSGRRIDPTALVKLERAFDREPIGRWEPELLASFGDMLRGNRAPSALELLDHLDAWRALLPEWENVRGRPQHDPYHRYTVDGHSFVAVRAISDVLRDEPIARRIAEEEPDLAVLYIATLLHDVGKGSGEDHSVAGEAIAKTAVERMGLSPDASEDVTTLVRHHLLLADTSTRRDLDDGSVIEATAKKLGTARRLRLLYVLTIADAAATGPEAWSAWKATLVRELYLKTLVALETGRLPVRSDTAAHAREVEAYEPALAGRAENLLASLPPSYLDSAPVGEIVDEMKLLLQAPKRGEVRVRVDPGGEGEHAVVTLCAPDRPGTLARAAGVFALNRISVLRAQAYSTTTGFALQRFIVSEASERTWQSFRSDVEAAFGGRLAVEAHVERKARDYHPDTPVRAEVRVVADASDDSTVIEVRSPDAVGLLYAVTQGLTDVDLDIHVAKIDTLGRRVVDVFYVRTLWGTPLDEAQVHEVRRSIEHRVARLFG